MHTLREKTWPGTWNIATMQQLVQIVIADVVADCDSALRVNYNV